MSPRSLDADVLVIGGGILGCATAYHLANRGIDCVLYERDAIGRAASGSNAGSLHFQLRHDEILSRGRKLLIRESIRDWRDFSAVVGEEGEVSFGGGLMVAETAGQASGLQDQLETSAAVGLDCEYLTSDDLKSAYTPLSDLLQGATLCRDEGSANPMACTQIVADLARVAGARIETQEEVVSVTPLRVGFRVQTTTQVVYARRVVCAAGAWTGALAESVGAEVRVGGHVHTVSVTEPVEPLMSVLIQHANGGLTMKQTKSRTVLIGGGWGGVYDRGSRTAWASPQGISASADLARRVLPRLNSANIVRSWGGLIARTPTRAPVIGRLPNLPDFYVAVVPSGSAGFTVAPTVGRLIAEALGEDKVPSELADYAPTLQGIGVFK